MGAVGGSDEAAGLQFSVALCEVDHAKVSAGGEMRINDQPIDFITNLKIYLLLIEKVAAEDPS